MRTSRLVFVLALSVMGASAVRRLRERAFARGLVAGMRTSCVLGVGGGA